MTFEFGEWPGLNQLEGGPALRHNDWAAVSVTPQKREVAQGDGGNLSA